MKGLDLSKFTKVGSNDTHTTFKHKDGHWIKVAHGGLTEKMRNDIKSLPLAIKGENEGVNPPAQRGGGESFAGEMVRKGDKSGAKEEHGQVISEMKSDKQDRKYMADGGSPQPTPSPTPTPTPPPSPNINQDTLDKAQQGMRNAFNYSKGGGVQRFDNGTPDAPIGQDTPTQDLGTASPITIQGDPTPESDPTQGEPVQAAATGTEQGVKPWLDQEANAYENDLANGHVKPETYQQYFGKKDTLGKIGTLFGLMVGGAGAGLTHQPNAVMGMIDKEIDRDLDAQKTSAANRQNFFNLNMQNPLVQAQAKKYGIDTKTAAFALGQGQTLQSVFHDNILKLQKMAPGLPKEQYRQRLLASYGPMREKMNNTADTAELFAQPPEQQEGPTQGVPAQQPGSVSLSPMLHPGAANMMQGMQYNPTAEKDYGDLNKQFTQAQQADKALATIGPTFDALTKNRTASGRTEQQGRKFSGMPFGVGELLHGPANVVAGAQPENRDYNSAVTTLKSDVANALRGTNVGSGDIDKIVDDNTPVYGDSPELIAQKRARVEGFIRRSVPTSLLQKYHMLGK
jgi:hypothetical protein